MLGMEASILAAQQSKVWARCPIQSNPAWVSRGRETAVAKVQDLGSNGAVEDLGVLESTSKEVIEGLGVRVINTAFAGNVRGVNNQD